MVRKLRELRADLRRAGFRVKPGRGKGDHELWYHDQVPEQQVNLDGRNGEDAQPYQERLVRSALAALRAAQGQTEERRP
ncbi:MAG TPA: hypothetical protein VFW96_06760 [Thermomicrobiales bacterium]|nr:hypothetical protein [Thermomicrobiales bacterium]